MVKQPCALITQNQLAEYLGSEVTTVEIAKYFTSQGYKVVIGTNNYERPISEEVGNLDDIWVYNINDKNLQSTVQKYDLKIIWVHHQLLPKFYLENIDKYREALVVYHHMSSYHPLEFPFLLRVEEDIADAILFNSSETKDAIEKKLGYKLPNTEIFYNASSDEFVRDSKKQEHNSDSHRILVVSNHIPSEVREAVKVLQKKDNFEVKICGYNDSFELVTPELISNFDTVITIGKTVQYGILSHVPVYCYDHFGGPGYLNKNNFEKAKYHNFSGRGFNKKSADQIVSEIEKFDNKSKDYYSFVSKESYEQITISKRMEYIIDFAKKNHNKRKNIDGKDIIAGIETLSFITLLYSHYIRIRNEKNEEINKLKSKIEQESSSCSELRKELDFIYDKPLLKWAIEEYKKNQE